MNTVLSKIPVSKPYVDEFAIANVNQALKDNAISGVNGYFISKFEHEFAKFCDTEFAVSCSNGTTALHLALVAAGIKAGDEVLVSTLTNMASFFSVLYIGAKPVAVDIDPVTLTMDPSDLERKITTKSRAIMVVHLFGHPTDMDSINSLAYKNNLMVFEDCAEAHGALYKGRKVGGLSDAGAFSFFANKIISTGEGGMVTTNNAKIAEKARSLRSLAFGNENKFMHVDIGFNYRLTNLQAAIGCGQIKIADHLIERRKAIAHHYNSTLSCVTDTIILPPEMSWAKSVYWMYHIILRDNMVQHRKAIMSDLETKGIETREGFIPFNLQEIFIAQGLTCTQDCPNANKVAYSSLYLPTGPNILQNELDYVSEEFIKTIHFIKNRSHVSIAKRTVKT